MLGRRLTVRSVVVPGAWVAVRYARVPHRAVLQPWFVRENQWRAARYGMDAIIIQNAAGDEQLVTEDLEGPWCPR